MKSFSIFIAVACLGFVAMAAQAFTFIKNEKLTNRDFRTRMMYWMLTHLMTLIRYRF